jgi:hypothetical protein
MEPEDHKPEASLPASINADRRGRADIPRLANAALLERQD